LTTLKSAVLAPMPSARVAMAMAAKLGFFRRNEKRKSWNSVGTMDSWLWVRTV
jgi:hypothetical protein